MNPAVTITTLDRIEGSLLAHASGDCLGATTEFMTAAEITARYGRVTDIIGGGAFGWRPGQGTDDTDLQLATTESLIASGGVVDLDDLGRRFIAWYNTRPADIGTTTVVGLRQLIETGDPTRSGVTDPHSAGNGSLMRMLGPGLAITDPDERRHYADASGAITHASIECRTACVAYTEVLYQLVDGTDVDETIAHVLDTVDVTPGISAALATPGLAEHTFQHGGHVVHSLAIAIAALRDAETTPTGIVIENIVNLGGDSDTNAAIAGGLLGARHGRQAIPARWIATLEQHDRLTAAAAALTTIRRS